MPIYSYQRFVSSGETFYDISLDYLSTSHIEVHVDGTKQTSGFTVTSSPNRVTFDSATTSGSIILIKRVTPKTKTDFQSNVVDFTDGSVLTETDLDNAALGLLYISQEAEDSASSEGLGLDQVDENWTAENKRIKNVSDPSAATDAVNKQYTDGLALYNSPSVPELYGPFTATASQTAFTLSPAPASTNVNSFYVDIDGVVQKPTTDFTVSGSTLTLTTGASAGQKVTVRNIGVMRDILGDNPTVTGNLSVSGTLGSTGAATMSSTLGVTGATTLTGGVAGNLNILTGALQMASSDVMTIRQFIMQDALATSESDALDVNRRWTQLGSSSTSYKVSGLRVSVPALKSSSSKLIIIMTPLLYGYSTTGERVIDVLGKIYKNNTASMTNDVNGSGIDGSQFRNRQNAPKDGVSITGSVSATDIGSFNSGAGFAGSEPPGDAGHTHAVDVPSHTHSDSFAAAYSGTAHSYVRPTWFFVIESPDTGATTYDLGVSANHADTQLYVYPKSNDSQMIAIEIG